MGEAKKKEEYMSEMDEVRKKYAGTRIIFLVSAMRQFAVLEKDFSYDDETGLVEAKKVCAVDPVPTRLASQQGGQMMAFNLNVFENATLHADYWFDFPETDQLYPQLILKLTEQLAPKN